MEWSEYGTGEKWHIRKTKFVCDFESKDNILDRNNIGMQMSLRILENSFDFYKEKNELPISMKSKSFEIHEKKFICICFFEWMHPFQTNAR